MESQVSERPHDDDKLTSLEERRERVQRQMSAAWDKPSPDMSALEVLHYELKNLEYRIAMHVPEEEAQGRQSLEDATSSSG